MSLSGGLGITVPRMDSATSWATWTENAPEPIPGDSRKRLDSAAQEHLQISLVTSFQDSPHEPDIKPGVTAPDPYAEIHMALDPSAGPEPTLTRGKIPRMSTSMFRWSDGTAYSQAQQTPLVFELQEMTAPLRTVSHAPPSVHEPDARQSYFAAPETFAWDSRPVSMMSVATGDDDPTPRPGPVEVLRCPSPFDYWETEYTKATMRLVNPSRSSSRLSLLPFADRPPTGSKSMVERPVTPTPEPILPEFNNPSTVSLDPFSDDHASSIQPSFAGQQIHRAMIADARTSTASPSSAPIRTPMSLPDFGSSLKPFLHWHKGRADIRAALVEAQSEVGSGRISVNVCGPRSLIDAVKEQVRTLVGAKQSLRGEVGLDFYAETFGW